MRFDFTSFESSGIPRSGTVRVDIVSVWNENSSLTYIRSFSLSSNLSKA